MRTSPNRSERGVALLIAIFVLMLISVIATALILMAGTESAFKANYKSAMHAFYDAKSGLEEGRGRLWPGHPNAFGTFIFPSGGGPMPIGRVRYIRNPSAGETVDPTDLSPSNKYADLEYEQEWGMPVTSASSVQTIASTSAAAGLAGPQYKWVRITPRTEQSGKIDVDGVGGLNNTDPLFYDGTQQLVSTGGGTLVPGGTQAWQVLTITALAVTPFGSRRMVQYTVAPTNLNLSLPAALTFAGPSPVYQSPGSTSFLVNGTDRSGSNLLSCPVEAQPARSALGVMNGPDVIAVKSAIPSGRWPKYTGSGAAPSISDVSGLLPPSEQTLQQVDALAQKITGLATEVVTGPATSLPRYGTASKPVIAVVQGDLNISGSVTGFGVLLVTGNLSFSGNFGWRGIVLVIGQGTINVNGSGTNEFDGAMFVAQTHDPSGNLLSDFGAPQVNWAGGDGKGIYYDSCWINRAAAAAPYQVLSFREVPQ
jgi:hypothetical protein